jgi:hypothetical protein
MLFWQFPDSRPTGSYPETGFAEISSDVPEADFWPGTTSGLLVTLPQARASKRGNSFEFRQADIAALIGRKLAYIVLLYCLASHPIQFERRSS